MPDEIKSNLEPINESDLNLEKKFKEGEATAVESAVVNPAEKEVAKEVGAVEKEASYQQAVSQVQTTPATGKDEHAVKKDASEVITAMDAEGQIQKLVDLASTKGVVHAVNVARHLEDNYVLDVLHDNLTGKLYDSLLAKGMIEKE